MRVIPDAAASSLHPFIESSVDPGSTIHIDGCQGYAGIDKKGYGHEISLIRDRPRQASKLLPRVRFVASLLKRWLLGTHQGAVGPQHLVYYHWGKPSGVRYCQTNLVPFSNTAESTYIKVPKSTSHHSALSFSETNPVPLMARKSFSGSNGTLRKPAAKHPFQSQAGCIAVQAIESLVLGITQRFSSPEIAMEPPASALAIYFDPLCQSEEKPSLLRSRGCGH
jgi:hypothetical protein